MKGILPDLIKLHVRILITGTDPGIKSNASHFGFHEYPFPSFRRSKDSSILDVGGRTPAAIMETQLETSPVCLAKSEWKCMAMVTIKATWRRL
jgi:hypothetical protein